MLITCPKCKSVYEIEPDVLPQNGRKMKCSRCREVFWCNRSDALVEQFMDLEKIVPQYMKEKKNSRSSQKNDDMAQVIRKTNQINLILSVVLAVIALFSLLLLRYDIVRFLPFMESVYSAVGLDSVYKGRGLEFVNIHRREYIEDNIGKLQITGEIYNTGKYEVIVPNINLQIVDKNGEIVLFEEHEIELNRLEPESTLSFKIITINPTPFAKSVYLTFSEK